MAQRRWQQPDSEPQTPTRPMSTLDPVFDIGSEESQADKSSLLYVMLPRMVKNRIRRIPSLRRSISTIGQSPFSDETETAGRRSSEELDSGFHTPPPQYRSRMSMALTDHVLDGNNSDYLDDETPQVEEVTTPFFEELRFGINWKFANQGLSLLNLAAQEANSPPSNSNHNSNANAPSLARQLYVHGLTYLLRALPQDLSPDERVSIWSSTPDEVLELSRLDSSSQDLVVGRLADDAAAEAVPSLVHRSLASFIVNLFLVFNFLFPYIKAFMASAYQYERRHRLSERVFASGMTTMDVAMKRSVQLSNQICELNEGKVGQALNSFVVWWVRGVTGGIHQGVGEGLVIMGMSGEEQQSPSRKGKQRR